MKLTTIEIPLPRSIGEIDDAAEAQGPVRYVPTGISPLDNEILGVINSDLLVLAGKPGSGKTSLATQILENAALAGVKSGLISLEMSAYALRTRMISARTGIEFKALLKRQLSPRQKKAVLEARAEIKTMGQALFIDDRSGLDDEGIYRTIGAWKEMGFGLVAIDYLQLIRGKNESRQVQVGDAVKAVKAAAKDFDLPVILLSQLNRSSDAREDKEPRMSDLRDSGEIEQVADTIIMFHYPEDDEFESMRAIDVHVVKQRNGPTTVVSMIFNKRAFRFQEINNG